MFPRRNIKIRLSEISFRTTTCERGVILGKEKRKVFWAGMTTFLPVP
jgi:hypothetical protein